MKPTLNGTTITPFSKRDFKAEEWRNAERVIEDINNCGIPRGQRRGFIESRLLFHNVSMECLMTLRNQIDRQNFKIEK